MQLARSFPKELNDNLKALEQIASKKKLSIGTLESCPLVPVCQWKVGNKFLLTEDDQIELWTFFLKALQEGLAGVDINMHVRKQMWLKIIHNRVSVYLSVGR